MDVLGDWGHVKDYVPMQWMMLQQDESVDFVIVNGIQFSVWQFIGWSVAELEIKLRFEGQGVDEVAIVEKIEGEKSHSTSCADHRKEDPRDFPPTEV
jgi:GDPmannose 4,6-dehydratase